MSNIPGDTRQHARRRRRSIAWIYYAIIAVVALFGIPSTHGLSLIAVAVAAAYAIYLFRGGRIVIWFW